MKSVAAKSVALIDHVGSKAGLDFYDSSLLLALELMGCRVKLYSNFISDRIALPTNMIFPFREKENIFSILPLYRNYKKAFENCKEEGTGTIILHLFHFDAFDERRFKLARQMGFKIIAIVHDPESFIESTDDERVRRICNESIDKLVVHNSFTRDALLSKLGNEAAGKIQEIPHGHFLDLPDPWISQSIARNHLGLKDEKVILFFGMIKKSKGLDVLLNALPLMNTQAILIIAGRMRRHSFSEYERLISQNSIGNQIRSLIRFISNKEREFLMKASDVIVLPYRKIFQSGVMLMAMSYGLPVIASNLEANQHVIKDEWNGLFFEDGNPASLALQLDRLLSDQAFGLELGINSKRHLAENHSWDNIARSFYSVID